MATSRITPALGLLAALLLAGCVPTPPAFTIKKADINVPSISEEGVRYPLVSHRFEILDVRRSIARQTSHLQAQALTKKATQDDAVLSGEFTYPAYKKIKNFAARLVRPNGWISPARGTFDFYTNDDKLNTDDTFASLWFFGNVVPGTIHESYFVLEGPFIFERFVLQQKAPTQDAHFHFSAPSSFGFHFKVYDGIGFPASRVQYEKRSDPQDPSKTLHTWIAKDIPGYELTKEAGVPDFNSRLLRIEIAPDHFTYKGQEVKAKSWDDIAAFETLLFEKKVKVTPVIRQKADEITKDASTPEDKILRIYAFINKDVRDVVQPMEVLEWGGQTAEETLQKLAGNDREKTALAIALLEAVGVKAHPARVRSSKFGELPKEIPNPISFDKTIAFVPSAQNEGLRFFTTHQKSPIPAGDPSLAGGDLLLLNGSSAQISKYPSGQTEDILRKITVMIDPKGAVTGTFEITASKASHLKIQVLAEKKLMGTEAEQKAWIEQHLAFLRQIARHGGSNFRLLDGWKLGKFTFLLGNDRTEAKGSFEGKLHKESQQKDLHFFDPDFQGYFNSSFVQPREHQPFVFASAGAYTTLLTFQGAHVLEHPPSLDLKTGEVEYTLKAQKQGQVYTHESTYRFPKRDLSQGEFNQARQTLEKIGKHERHLVIFRLGPADTDGDGIPDDKDKCPTEKGIPENEGCPDRDRDGDGIIDRLDKCPDVPGVKELNGCPKKILVIVTETQIQILQKIFFALNSDKIQNRSFSLLDQVVSVLNSRPLIRIQIEGHTDTLGKRPYNIGLSKRRAASVRKYLIGKGIKEERLQSEGFGPDKPLVPNTTKANREKNRRVEFNIVKEKTDKKDESPNK